MMHGSYNVKQIFPCSLLEVIRDGRRFFALICLILSDVKLILRVFGIFPRKRIIFFADMLCWSAVNMYCR